LFWRRRAGGLNTLWSWWIWTSFPFLTLVASFRAPRFLRNIILYHRRSVVLMVMVVMWRWFKLLNFIPAGDKGQGRMDSVLYYNIVLYTLPEGIVEGEGCWCWWWWREEEKWLIVNAVQAHYIYYMRDV